MANEVIKVKLFGANNDGNPMEYTVASSAAIPKGSILALSDPRTVTLYAVASGAAVAGIASMEKANDDFSTTISVWTDGVFDMVTSKEATVGEAVMAANAITASNAITLANATATKGSARIIGYARETGSDAERIEVRVKL